MNGLLGAQLGAQSGMTSNGVMGYADLIRKKLMETLAPKTAEEIKSETPQPTAPKDYTAGLTPPEIGGVPSKLEFKATPNRLSAFMVALGNIMQNKYNTERAKEEQAQGLYESRMKSGQALNNLQTELEMKRQADEANPETKLTHAIKEEQLKQLQAMNPIKLEKEQTKLQKLIGGGASSGGGKKLSDIMGGSTGTFAGFIKQNATEFDPTTKEPIITPEVLQTSYRQFLMTNPSSKERTAADKFVSTYAEPRKPSTDTQVYDYLVTQGGMTPTEAKAEMKRLGRQTPEERGAAAYQTQKEGIKGAIAGAKEAGGQSTAPVTPTVTPSTIEETPEQKRLREYKAKRGLK